MKSPAHTGTATGILRRAGCVAGQLAGVERWRVPPAFVSPGLSSLARQLPGWIALVVAGAFYSPAQADTWSAGRGASSVELRSTDIPGAVAELHFNNTSNDSGTRLTYDWQLTHDGLTVRGQVDLGTGEADTIRAQVPDGFIAYPDTETIPDGTVTTIVIYPLNAVGM
jgi:hypothetical protein